MHKKTVLLNFSRTDPFKKSVFSVTFVLGNQQSSVHQQQELHLVNPRPK